MANVQNRLTGDCVLLRAHHVFGRSRTKADTVIPDASISLVHASVRWDGSGWELVDHSRNGIWLNDKRLTQPARLKAGDQISFLGDKSQTWTVLDDKSPQTMLIGLTEGSKDMILESMHTLPNEENPELFFYTSEQGRWVMADAGKETELTDGDIVALGPDLRWRFQAATVDVNTVSYSISQSRVANYFIFEFAVSADEEHTSLKVHHDNHVFDLGERVHHYLLLTLARKKMEDLQDELGEVNEGWIEISDLQKMLGLDYCHMNIQIYRARQQFKKQINIPLSDEYLLERRSGSIRFGGKHFSVSRAGKLEGSYPRGFKLMGDSSQEISKSITKQ